MEDHSVDLDGVRANKKWARKRRGKVFLNSSEVKADSAFSMTSFCHMFTSVKGCIGESGHPSALTGCISGEQVHDSF